VLLGYLGDVIEEFSDAVVLKRDIWLREAQLVTIGGLEVGVAK
jgi:hypothetical protein